MRGASSPCETLDPVTVELRLDPMAQSPARARVFVREETGRLGADESARDAAETLVSELVTNVVLHARTTAAVRVSAVARDILRISVCDGSAAGLRQRRYGLEQSTGRGIRLVAVLSSSWGVEPSTLVGPQGKEVWFQLPTHPGPADDEASALAMLELFGVGEEGVA